MTFVLRRISLSAVPHPLDTILQMMFQSIEMAATADTCHDDPFAQGEYPRLSGATLEDEDGVGYF